MTNYDTQWQPIEFDKFNFQFVLCVEILSIPINVILSYENSLFYIQWVMLTPPHMQVERR